LPPLRVLSDKESLLTIWFASMLVWTAHVGCPQGWPMSCLIFVY